MPIGGEITSFSIQTPHALQHPALSSAGDSVPTDFSLQQSLPVFSFWEVGQQGLPQSSPHAQPVQSHALHSQFVHAPSAQPHSVHRQSFPQQQDAAGALSALTANVGIVRNTAMVAIAKPPKIFEKVNIFLSSLRMNSAWGSSILKLKIHGDSHKAS